MVRKEVVWFDADGNVVPGIEQAVQARISEYDEEGNLVRSIIGYVDKPIETGIKVLPPEDERWGKR